MIPLLLATRNPHKLAEVRAILGPSVICQSLQDFPRAPEVIEDATTFAGNATKKAVALATWLAAMGDREDGGPRATKLVTSLCTSRLLLKFPPPLKLPPSLKLWRDGLA